MVSCMDRMLRKYPQSFWMCRKNKEFRICAGVEVCIQMYLNLICDHGLRPLPEMEAKT